MSVLLASNKKIFKAYQEGRYTPNDRWFNVEDRTEDHAEIFIYDEISFFGVMAIDVAEQIRALDVNTINLHINSPGGLVFDGTAIYNLFRQHDAEVTVKVDGLAASIASIIAMAGDDIQMADSAQLMIHNPMTFIMGDAEDLRQEAKVLDNIKTTLVGIYDKRSSLDAEAIGALMDEEKWMLADYAIENGFADSTYEGLERAARLDFELLKDYANFAPPAVKEPVSVNKSGTPFKLLRAKAAYYEDKYNNNNI